LAALLETGLEPPAELVVEYEGPVCPTQRRHDPIGQIVDREDEDSVQRPERQLGRQEQEGRLTGIGTDSIKT
jgi:hypothetical protein